MTHSNTRTYADVGGISRPYHQKRLRISNGEEQVEDSLKISKSKKSPWTTPDLVDNLA